MPTPIRRLWVLKNGAPAVACIAFHAAADLLLISRVLLLDDAQTMVVIALPLSQCSLCSIWTATSRSNIYARFAVSVCGVMGSWYVLTMILPWGIGDAAAAAWMLAMIVQTLTILIAIKLYPLARDVSDRGWAEATRSLRSYTTFDLLSLLLWTAVVAVLFGLIQFGRAHWQWSSAIADWDYFDAMPIVGVFSAAIAILWLWALFANRLLRRNAGILLVALAVAGLAMLLPYLTRWATGLFVLGFRESFIIATAQSVFLVGSLAVSQAVNSKP